MKVDFHTHSTASDGTFAPASLAEEGCAAGLAAMALTDHDSVGGLRAFLAAAPLARRAASLVPGVELSVEPGPRLELFHLLGLGVDPSHPALAALLDEVLEGRNARNARIIANFNRLGFGMGEEVLSYANGRILARPHFARWLVERGHATTAAEAFEKYLLPDSPKETRCYEERIRPSQERAISAIHAAGGLCVLAHPRYGRRAWRGAGPDYAVAERAAAELKEKGLDGVEALYQANTPEENVAFVRMADRLGLLKTAGSDFHGANKPAVTLGMEVSEAFAAPLLERLGMARSGRGET